MFIIVIADLFWKSNGFDGKAYVDVFSSITSNFLSFVFITIIFSLLTIVLTAIFNDSKKAKISIIVFVTLILFINDIKYKMMNIPIQLIDVGYLNPENMEMMKESTSTAVGLWLLKPIFKAIIMIFLCVFISILDKFHNYKFKNIKRRIFTGIIGLIGLILPFIFINGINKFLL